MAVNYSTTLKNTRMDAITTALSTSPLLVIGTSGLSGATGVLATVTLASTAFGASSNGVITLASTPRTATASAAGTAALAELRTSGGTVICSGLTVGTSGTNIIINSTTITNGQTVNVTSGTLTHG